MQEDNFVAYPKAVVQNKEKEQREYQMDRNKDLDPSRVLRWTQTGETASIMVHSTPKIFMKF